MKIPYEKRPVLKSFFLWIPDFRGFKLVAGLEAASSYAHLTTNFK